MFLLAGHFSFAQRYWVATSSSNWNNTSNWSASPGGPGGQSVPVAGVAAIFDNLGTGSCTIDAAVNVLSLTVNSGYTGTITQGSNTITVSTTAVFAGGTFTGGSANITITGAFTLSGTAFTSTSAILQLRDNSAFTSGSFAHNNGTLQLNANISTQTLSGTSPTLYNLELVGIFRTYAISSTGSVVVLNNLNITGGGSFFNITTGTIDVRGDINVTNSAMGCGGDATININGTGTQNFNGNTTAGQGALPKLTINKASGVLNLINFPSVSNDFTYTAGTVNAGTSTFCFTRGSSGTMAITGSLTLNHIAFTVNTSGLTATIGAATTLTCVDLLIAGSGNMLINTGNINVNGNINLTNTALGGGGSATINLIGTTDQTMDGNSLTVNQSRLPIVSINKPSGTLFLANSISFANHVTYLAGTINATTSTAFVVTSNITITGNFSLYNLTIQASGTTVLTIASGNTLTVTNNFTITGSGSSSIGTGTIAAQGNIIITNTGTAGGGSGTLLINGTGSQTITSTGVVNEGRLPQVTINKATGTLIFPALITPVGNWTYMTGALDVTTNNSTIVFPVAITITGSHTLNNINFAGASNPIFVIAPGTVLTAADMTMSGSGNVTLNTGTINLNGNLNLTNTAVAGGGTTVIAFVGTTNQAITGSLLINQCRLPFITINKPSGTLTFPSLITVRGNWTYIAGTLDVVTNNSNIIFSNTLTIAGNHTLNTVTFDGSNNLTFTLTGITLTVGGDLNISGANNVILSNGIINLNGNLVLSNTATGGGGNTVIAFVGTTDQNITSALPVNQSNLPAVTINKASGILIFPALITVRGDWTYTAGTLNVSTNNSTVVFANSLGTGFLTIAGSHSLNNVTFEGISALTLTVATGTLLTVTGTLTTMGNGNVFLNNPVSGTTIIQAQGDIIINNTSAAGGGTGAVLINGTTAQTFTGNSSSGLGKMAFIKIQKVSGTLTLAGTISASRDWAYISGTVDPSSSTIVFGGNNLAISSAGMSFNNLIITTNNITLSNNLSANGNLTISGGVLIAGANTINLKGSWSNYGTGGFTEGTSTLNFNGTSVQTLACTGGESLVNLIVNNSGAGIQLSNDAIITTLFTMTLGNINLNGNMLSLGTSISIRGTLARTSGTIYGAGSFRRWFNTTTTIADGSIAGLFPVGSSVDYRPVSVSAPTTGPTTGGTIAISHTNVSSTSAVSFADGASTLQARQDSFWTMITANSLAGGTYNLKAEGTGFGSIGSVSDLRITLVNSVTGTAGTNAGIISNPQIIRTGLSLANLSNSFYVGSVNSIGSPLPITLLSFSLSMANGIVEIDWATLSEINNDYFAIQRSKDGIVWESIEEVDGAGNTKTRTTYAAYDQSPYTGTSYYLLKQTDFDGKESFSPVRKLVNASNEFFKIVAYPNPASDYIIVTGYSASAELNIVFLNHLGQKMDVAMQGNASGILLQVSDMKEGIYFIQIHSAGLLETKRIVVSR